MFPLLNRGGQKAAVNLESDLKNTSINDLLTTTAGLIIGLFIAYLISRGIYTSIEIPIVGIILNIITYIILGGLGILMTRRMTDRQTYARADGRNVLTLYKRLA